MNPDHSEELDHHLAMMTLCGVHPVQSPHNDLYVHHHAEWIAIKKDMAKRQFNDIYKRLTDEADAYRATKAKVWK